MSGSFLNQVPSPSGSQRSCTSQEAVGGVATMGCQNAWGLLVEAGFPMIGSKSCFPLSYVQVHSHDIVCPRSFLQSIDQGEVQGMKATGIPSFSLWGRGSCFVRRMFGVSKHLGAVSCEGGKLCTPGRTYIRSVLSQSPKPAPRMASKRHSKEGSQAGLIDSMWILTWYIVHGTEELYGIWHLNIRVFSSCRPLCGSSKSGRTLAPSSTLQRIRASTANPAAPWLGEEGSSKLGVLSLSGHMTASSNRVTFNSSYSWEHTKLGLNSGFGIVVVCPGLCS